MLSENSNDQEESILIETAFHRSAEEAMPDQERKLFSQKLRHFYRTGEKSTDDQVALNSIMWTVLENIPDTYPLEIGDTSITQGIDTPIWILQQLLEQHQKSSKARFKGKIQELIDGLKDMLSMDKGSSQLEKTYDFANEIIAFDRLSDVITKKSVEELPEEKMQRLQSVLENLKKGLGYFGDEAATIITNKKHKTLFKDYSHANLVLADPKDAFSQAQKIFHDQMHSFSTLIQAYRIAQLEIDGNYQKDVHDDYFSHFTWHQLSREELTLFHPVILISTHEYLIEHLGSFSRLLAANMPVKVMVLNDHLVTAPEKNMSWEDASRQFREELATISLSHRNAFLFQSPMDDANYVQEGITKGLETSAPAVIHLLNASGGAQDLQLLKAAVAGRMFPRITYDPNKDSLWGNRFDVSANIQSSNYWPNYQLSVNAEEDAQEQLEVSFTYADYKALHSKKIEELMLIPPDYDHKLLVPLDEYLQLDEQQLYGKIPYIWLSQENNQLMRVAVPNVWVVSCQERLDYWKFIQEIGGDHREDSHEVTEPTPVDDLQATHQEEIEKIQEEAVAKAAERLISALLDDEDLVVTPLESSEPIAEPESTPAQKEEKQAPASAPVEQAWVESESCTSCNDCTDKYPHIFKYNDDKLAYIPDPGKGSFEELVKAAEKCPAECIHPGMPQNNTEPNLEKLKKRAEKYN